MFAIAIQFIAYKLIRMNNGVKKDFLYQLHIFFVLYCFFINLIKISKHINDKFKKIMFVSVAEMCVRNFKVKA